MLRFPLLTLIVASLRLTNAWWDIPHLMVAQIAVEYSSKADIYVLNRLLSEWNDDWPLSGNVLGASLWLDDLRCENADPPTCVNPPSLTIFNEWHRVNLYAGVGGAEPTAEQLDHERTFGEPWSAVRLIEEAVRTMSTTNSRWAANFMLRMFLHAFQDLHNPVHASIIVSPTFPAGDFHAHRVRWRSDCPTGNPPSLHALWDSIGNQYRGEFHAGNASFMLYYARHEARSLRQRTTPLPTDWFVDEVALLDPKNRTGLLALVNQAQVFRRMALESLGLSETVVYSPLLDLTPIDAMRRVNCPTDDYITTVRLAGEQLLHVAGRRLAAVLRHFAAAIRKITRPKYRQHQQCLPAYYDAIEFLN